MRPARTTKFVETPFLHLVAEGAQLDQRRLYEAPLPDGAGQRERGDRLRAHALAQPNRAPRRQRHPGAGLHRRWRPYSQAMLPNGWMPGQSSAIGAYRYDL